MNRTDALVAAKLAAIFGFGIGASYLLALAGEPQSAWLWSLVL